MYLKDTNRALLPDRKDLVNVVSETAILYIGNTKGLSLHVSSAVVCYIHQMLLSERLPSIIGHPR